MTFTDHKKWFANQFLQNLDTKASLAERYNLKPHILQTWRDCVRKGIPFPDKKVDLLCGTAVLSNRYRI